MVAELSDIIVTLAQSDKLARETAADSCINLAFQTPVVSCAMIRGSFANSDYKDHEF